MQLGGREAHKTVKRVDFRGLGVHKESDGLHTRGELRAHGGGFDRGNAAQAFLVEIESEHVRASVAGGLGVRPVSDAADLDEDHAVVIPEALSGREKYQE